MNKTSLHPAETAFGWFWFVIHTFLLPSELNRFLALFSLKLSGSALNAVYYTVSLVVLFLVYGHFFSSSAEGFRKKFWDSVQAAVVGFVMFAGGTVLYRLACTRFFGGVTLYNQQTIETLAKQSLIPVCYCTLFAAPICEEMLLRGVVFTSLRKFGSATAYVLSALLFASMHIWQYAGSADVWSLLLSGLCYVPAGIALAWVYHKSNNIFAPILLHFVINLISFINLPY